MQASLLSQPLAESFPYYTSGSLCFRAADVLQSAVTLHIFEGAV